MSKTSPALSLAALSLSWWNSAVTQEPLGTNPRGFNLTFFQPILTDRPEKPHSNGASYNRNLLKSRTRN